MKCTFCGNNVPDGSELCPECGMILSLDGDNDAEISVPAFAPNVFGSEPIKTPEMPEGYEESAFSSEFSVPEYNPDSIILNNEAEAEPLNEEDYTAEPEAVDEAAEDYAAEDTVTETAEESVQPEAPAYEPVSFDEEPEEIYEAPAYGDEEIDASFGETEILKASADDIEYEGFADVQPDESFIPYAEADEAEGFTPVIVPVEDAAHEEVISQAQEPEYEELPEADDDDDTYIRSGNKSRIGTAAALCVLLVVLVVAGGYIVKKVFPADGTTTTEPSAIVIATATDATTEPSTQVNDTTAPEETTAPSVTDDTTETDTTAPDTTEPSEEPTTEPSTEPSTEPATEPVTESTTRPSTTRPSTTKPTTKPSKPTTTVDPYGINGNAEIKKPSSYLSESYIGYTNRKVDILGGPSSSSDWVQSLGKGGEVKVLAEQSGYSYVYSTRFGTYGWIKSSYISDSRPVEATTTVSNDTVKPDKNGSGEIMCTTYSLNLRTGPGKSYDSIKVIPVNYQVKIIGYKSGVSGWAYVTDLVSGKNGWVSTDYLTAAE